jgi:hypothetical protein
MIRAHCGFVTQRTVAIVTVATVAITAIKCFYIVK